MWQFALLAREILTGDDEKSHSRVRLFLFAASSHVFRFFQAVARCILLTQFKQACDLYCRQHRGLAAFVSLLLCAHCSKRAGKPTLNFDHQLKMSPPFSTSWYTFEVNVV